MVLHLGVTGGAGTVSWSAPRDLVFTGAQLGNAAAAVAAVISTIPALQPTSFLFIGPSFSVFYWLGGFSTGKQNCTIPVPAGETIYVAFSAAGTCLLYFDEVAS
jgi:hypothetical protein